MGAREVEREALFPTTNPSEERRRVVMGFRVSDIRQKVWYCPKCLGEVERRVVSDDMLIGHFLDVCLAGCGWRDWPFGDPASFKESARARA